MAVSAKLYGLAVVKAFNKEIDFDSDTIKAILVSASYTPDQDAHDYLNDVTANEETDGSYARKTLASKAVSYNSGTNVIKIDADDLLWSALTSAGVRYVIIADTQTGVDSTSPLIAYIDLGTTIAPTGQDLSIAFNAAGIATVTVS